MESGWDLVIRGALEQGLVYGLAVLGVYLSFRVLNVPDLTVDGTFPLGGAVAAVMLAGGTPSMAATLLATLAGAVAGAFTGFLHARWRMSPLLAGILTMTALFSVNLRVMGRPNIPLLRVPTAIDQVAGLGVDRTMAALVLFIGIALVAKVAVDAFLGTHFGLALRATGDNEAMARSMGVDTGLAKTVGLALANGLVALSGALVAQYQGFADVGMGIGTIVAALASVIIGEALLRPARVATATVAALVGSLGYRAVIVAALRAGFAPTDLKLVTALMVIAALTLPAMLPSGLHPFRRRGATSSRRVVWPPAWLRARPTPSPLSTPAAGRPGGSRHADP